MRRYELKITHPYSIVNIPLSMIIITCLIGSIFSIGIKVVDGQLAVHLPPETVAFFTIYTLSMGVLLVLRLYPGFKRMPAGNKNKVSVRAFAKRYPDIAKSLSITEESIETATYGDFLNLRKMANTAQIKGAVIDINRAGNAIIRRITGGKR